LKAFIDTSALIKKYIQEKGAAQFDVLLERVSEITVAPIYLLEIYSALQRRLKEETLTREQASWLKSEIKKDYNFFHKVIWNENLEKKSLQLIEKYHLKTLDSIQLAAGCLSETEVFMTSDRELFDIAKRELKTASFV